MSPHCERGRGTCTGWSVTCQCWFPGIPTSLGWDTHPSPGALKMVFPTSLRDNFPPFPALYTARRVPSSEGTACSHHAVLWAVNLPQTSLCASESEGAKTHRRFPLQGVKIECGGFFRGRLPCTQMKLVMSWEPEPGSATLTSCTLHWTPGHPSSWPSWSWNLASSPC